MSTSDTTTIELRPNDASPKGDVTIDASTGVITEKKSMLAHLAQLVLPNPAELMRKAAGFETLANLTPVTTAEEYEMAAELLGEVKTAVNDSETQRTAASGPLHKAWKAVNDMFTAPKAALERAESGLKKKLLDFDAAQERLRQAAELKAKQDAEAEQRRLDAIAAQERADAEAAQAKLEQEAQALRDEAAALEAAGNTAAAAEVAAKATQAESQAVEVQAGIEIAETVHEQTSAALASAATAAITQPASAPKVSGIGKRTTYVGEVHDKMAFLKFIVGRPEYLDLVDVNQAALNKIATAQGKHFAMDGAKSAPKISLSARAK